MERRSFLEGAIVATTGLAVSTLTGAPALAEDAKATKPSTAKPNHLVVQNADAVKDLSQFAEVAARCSFKGEVCVQHCDERLATGATEFSLCSVSARQMIVLCDAVEKLASMKSVRIKDMLDACVNACQACKDACDEHKAHWAHGMHLECKECAEQCEKTVAAANKLKKVLKSI